MPGDAGASARPKLFGLCKSRWSALSICHESPIVRAKLALNKEIFICYVANALKNRGHCIVEPCTDV